MKKWLAIFLVTIASISLFACNKSEFKNDGVFTAFEVSASRNNPQITWVSVLIEKGEVKEFFIDERQTTNGVWNEKTKKELKFDYNMAGASPIKKEWFEQAETIELFFVKHGVDALKLNDEGYIDGLTGATMAATSYKKLAQEALEKAKKGIYTAFEVSDSYGAVQVTWVDAHYNKKGELTSFNIDELQSKDNKWNEFTKKELKYDYNMAGASPIGKEWFEQAEVIENFMLENKPEDLNLNDAGYIDGLTGATMKGASYKELAIKARDFKDSKSFENGKAILPEPQEPEVEEPEELTADVKFVKELENGNKVYNANASYIYFRSNEGILSFNFEISEELKLVNYEIVDYKHTDNEKFTFKEDALKFLDGLKGQKITEIKESNQDIDDKVGATNTAKGIIDLLDNVAKFINNN